MMSIIKPEKNDVLSGRGKFASSWAGNVFYREMIQRYKLEYVIADSLKRKQELAVSVFSQVNGLTPSGRFLIYDQETKMWHVIGYENALRKIKQALREDAPNILLS